MRKLTPSVIAEARRLRAQGRTLAEIATELGLSKGSVGNALRAGPAPAAPPPPPAAGEPEPEAEADLGDLEAQLSWLSSVAAQRRRDADRLRRGGDDAGAARATRDALSAAALLARHSPRPERPGVWVEAEQMTEAAQQCRAALRQLVERERERTP